MMLTVAAGDLADIGSAVAARNAAAATPIAGVVPAAADPVSALTAAQFAGYGQLYRALSSQAEAVLDAFVTVLNSSAASYAVTEVANAFGAAESGG
jgi:hypothetical protein